MPEKSGQDTSKASSVGEMYEIRRADPYFSKHIPPRRLPFPTFARIFEGDEAVAHVDVAQSAHIADSLMDVARISEYKGCSTFERAHPSRRGWAHRPITHAARQSEQQALTDLYEEFGARMYAVILAGIEPPTQAYDKNSRIGAPVYEIAEHKLQILMPYFMALLAGDLSLFERSDVHIINNVRLQAEKLTKDREYVYVSEQGRAYSRIITAKDRFDSFYKRWCSRVRLVFNYPVANLLLQIVDTAIHNWFLKFIACHHNMTARIGKPLPGVAKFLDVKHFERAIGSVIQRRHAFIGGLYSRIMERMLEVPYLVPGDDGNVFTARVRHEAGFVEQLGSGISAVAPIAKEVLMLVYAKYFMDRRSMTFEKAFETALNGGTSGLYIMNYGDDNVIYGDAVEVEACFSHMQKYLTVEEEVPAKFLGHHYTPEFGFYMSVNSYVLNLHLAERAPGTRFRPYPFLGYQLRRELFQTMGEPRIRNDVYPAEDRLLSEHGYTIKRLAEAAEKEQEQLSAVELAMHPLTLLGKEYLLTEEQKLADPNYDVLTKEATRGFLKTLLGKG